MALLQMHERTVHRTAIDSAGDGGAGKNSKPEKFPRPSVLGILGG